MKIIGTTISGSSLIEVDDCELETFNAMLKAVEPVAIPESEYDKKRLTRQLALYFAGKGYCIVDLIPKANINKADHKLAVQILNHRNVLLPFVKDMLHCKKATCFAYDIAGWAAGDIVSLNNFCKELLVREWICDFKKDKNTVQFQLVSNFDKSARSFLHGKWMEIAALRLIESALQDFSKKIDGGFKYRLFYDVKLKKYESEKSNDIQLDFVVQLPDRFLIFETKSGFMLNITRWAELHNLFSDDKNRYITCCADDTLNPLIFSPCYLLNLGNLYENVTNMLNSVYSVTQ